MIVPSNRVLRTGLALAGLLYCSYGLFQATVGTSEAAATDLRLRWVDHTYAWRGQNPFDVWAGARGLATAPGRDASVDPRIGPPGNGGYPPWALATGFLFVPPLPALSAARLVFGAASALALGVVAAWAWRMGRHTPGADPWLFAAAATALVANLFSVSAGQYSVIVNACLITAWRCNERGRYLLAGIALGIAQVKPQVGGLFVLAFLVKGSIGTVSVAAVVVAMASLVASWWVDTGVVEMLRQTVIWSGEWITGVDGYGPLTFLFMAGVDPGLAQLACAVVGGAATLWLLVAWRRAPVAVLFAIAAVGGRLAAYHGVYDNTMLVFLLVALGVTWERSGRPWLLTSAGALLGLTLWSPVTYQQHDLPALQAAHIVIWGMSLYALLRFTPRRPLQLE